MKPVTWGLGFVLGLAVFGLFAWLYSMHHRTVRTLAQFRSGRERLDRNLRSLRAEVRRLQARIDGATAEPRIEPDTPAGPVQKKVDEPPRVRKPRFRQSKEEVSRIRTSVLDPAATAYSRVKSLAWLRLHAPGERGGDVAGSMIHLAQTSSAADVRSAVLRHMKGVKTSAFRDALLVFLRSDQDDSVRGEAAESLEPMKSDPLVRAALEDVLLRDPSNRVREEIRRIIR